MALQMFDRTKPNAPGHYDASHTALLLLDYKHRIIERIGPKAHSAAIAAIKMRDWAKHLGIKVIHGLVDFSGPPPFSTSKEALRLQNIMDHLTESGGNDEPIDKLQGRDDLKFYRHPGHISALRSANLKEYLRQHNIQSLLIMGLGTGGCVLRTAFDASEDGYVVTVISDGCADADQELHDIAFDKLLKRTTYVAHAAEFQSAYAEVLRS